MNRQASGRPGYRALSVYRTEASPAEVDLSDNTNLFGSAPSAVASLASWAATSPARYPTLVTEDLRAGLADWIGVAPDNIVGGCGSNDILDSAMRALGEPGSKLAYTSPTFVMTPHFAAANSLVPVPVATLPDGEPDVEGLLATGASIIYVASPNNPSGRAASRQAIETLLDRAPGLVLLDEAYTEYTGRSWARDAVSRGNAIVTRTFSKAWGLAGLRIGYGVGSAALMAEVEKARGPYKVNAVAERAAAAAVRNDRAWLDGLVATTVAMRESVVERLGRLGFDATGSSANFIPVRVPDARLAAEHLASRSVAVRAFPGQPGRNGLLRVTIGPEPMMARLLDGLGSLPK